MNSLTERMAKIMAQEVSFTYHIFKLLSCPLVRDKSRELMELLENSSQLQNEREFARQTRDKM